MVKFMSGVIGAVGAATRPPGAAVDPSPDVASGRAESNRTSRVDTESRALLAAAAGFVLAGPASVFYFLTRSNPISGQGSVGDTAAVAAAVIGLIAFAASYTNSYLRPAARRSTRLRRAVDIFDLLALALAHATVILLIWAVVFFVLQQAFSGARLHPLAAGLLVGGAVAISAYFAYLSGSNMTVSRLSLLLLVFLVGGVLTSMLTASDPRWWVNNISALGITTDVSGVTFNFTLAIAGIILTTLAQYGTKDLRSTPVARSSSVHSIRSLRWTITILGIFLASVGLFPANRLVLVHNTAATGMVLTFMGLIVVLRWLCPMLPVAFLALGYVFVVFIAIAVVLWYPIGYFGLTGLELISASLIFLWVVVFVRVLAASHADEFAGVTH
ncbi:MAG: hypothetical protein V4531_10590 [Actinomycetota bacterium]